MILICRYLTKWLKIKQAMSKIMMMTNNKVEEVKCMNYYYYYYMDFEEIRFSVFSFGHVERDELELDFFLIETCQHS